MDLDHLCDLVADPHHRVERRQRLLEDHPHGGAAQFPQLLLGQGEQVPAPEEDAARARLQVLRQQAHDGVGGHRLAGTGLANHAQNLAGIQRQVDVAHRIFAITVGGQPDGQPFDAQQRFLRLITRLPDRASADSAHR